MILSAVPASQGIYGFAGFFVWMLFVEDFAANGAMLFGVGATAGLVCMFSAIRQGQICANGITNISQGHDVMTNTLIYAALPEFFAILALVCSLLIIPIIVTTLIMHKPTVTGFSCIVFLSVAIYHVGDASPYTYAMNRLLDTVIGIIVALAVNLIMPGAAPIKPPEELEK